MFHFEICIRKSEILLHELVKKVDLYRLLDHLFEHITKRKGRAETDAIPSIYLVKEGRMSAG